MKLIEKEIEVLLPQRAQELTQFTGISTLNAAIIYTETKGKKMTKAQFASYTGVEPVDCSSGLTQKHRNNRRGNRQLNSLFYQMSIHQSLYDEKGSEYFNKKLELNYNEFENIMALPRKEHEDFLSHAKLVAKILRLTKVFLIKR